MADYIPQNDAKFNLRQTNMIDIVDYNLTDWSLLVEDFWDLVNSLGVRNALLARGSNKRPRTSFNVQAKNNERGASENNLNSFIAKWLTNNSKVSNCDSELMGLIVKLAIHPPKPAFATLSVETVDFSIRLLHTNHFSVTLVRVAKRSLPGRVTAKSG